VLTPNQTVVDKEFVSDANRCFDEVVACRDALEKFKNERAKTEAERHAADTLIASLNQLVAVKDRIIEAQAKLIDFYEKALNKPKSTFDKFLNGVKEVLKAAVFILIGRGL
jgi:type I site-specific restriction endonuclease